jgi:hypothetical protein
MIEIAKSNLATPAERRGQVSVRHSDNWPRRRNAGGMLEQLQEIRRVTDAVFDQRGRGRDVPVWFIRARQAESLMWQERAKARQSKERRHVQSESDSSNR